MVGPQIAGDRNIQEGGEQNRSEIADITAFFSIGKKDAEGFGYLGSDFSFSNRERQALSLEDE